MANGDREQHEETGKERKMGREWDWTRSASSASRALPGRGPRGGTPGGVAEALSGAGELASHWARFPGPIRSDPDPDPGAGCRVLLRKPTRLELKLGRHRGVESVRKELEVRAGSADEAERRAGGEEAQALALRHGAQSREQLNQRRGIGYKPQPKAGGRTAHFGTFEF
ncbi:LOW QUALITY PROTEIN: anaphase-promoting complex subunit CDC26 [Manacus vitellinus]|uniref:LOW QUALITY PROTEIN: anaphase-promoting complex subunit CDC26 n=1 Tax=Manacus vitellinus TaxID=328815 RepID=UPI00115C65B3|nr:LOW QUALITY PROTEIN: anaphase-promoting complex subunit CDC26 [Manacus vitellinus]